jgi:hypothetical protein
MKHAASAIALLMLAACSGHSSNDSAADAQADNLDNAAEQSTPAAADELHNQADAIRENGASGAPGQPGSSTQQAVDKAAKAQDDATQAPVPGAAPLPKQGRPSGTEKNAPEPPPSRR